MIPVSKFTARITNNLATVSTAAVLITSGVVAPALSFSSVHAETPTAVCQTVNAVTPAFPAAPELLTPTNTSTDGNGFDFSWSAIAGAAQYDWESSLSPSTATTDGNFSNVLGSHRLGATAINEGNSPADTYYWHVRAVAADGTTGAWSQVWSVTLDTSGASFLSAPALTAPANGATCNIYSEDFYFTWNAPTSTGNHGSLTYIFQSGHSAKTDPTTGDFIDQPWQDNGITDTFIFDGNSPTDTYYWHIRAVGSDGTLGPWSTTWMVTITHNAPVVIPDPVEPSDPTTPPTDPTSSSSDTDTATAPTAPAAQQPVVTQPSNSAVASILTPVTAQSSVLGSDTSTNRAISASKTEHASFASVNQPVSGNWFARHGIMLISMLLALCAAVFAYRRYLKHNG